MISILHFTSDKEHETLVNRLNLPEQTYRSLIPQKIFDPHSEFDSEYIMDILGEMEDDFIFPKNVMNLVATKCKRQRQISSKKTLQLMQLQAKLKNVNFKEKLAGSDKNQIHQLQSLIEEFRKMST